jgi:predicted alpha/beta superfamily hydrolase
MKTKRIVAVTLLLVMVLVAGYSSVGAGGLTGTQRMMVAPVARQVIRDATPADPTPPQPVTLLDAEMRIFHSENTDQDYRIYVSLPPGYDADSPPKYPVIYSLDGNWHFPLDEFASRQLVMGEELGKLIIVGIGYPTDNDEEIQYLRWLDMVPENRADAFLAFLQEELIPYIDTNYLTAKNDITLAGHSYGGLFTLYALFTAPDAFDRYMAMSPALWYHPDWDGKRLIFDLEQEYYDAQNPDNPKLPVQLFLSAGELEPEDEWWGAFQPWMVSNVIEFNEVLESRGYKDLSLDMRIIEGLGHAGSYPGAFTRGLVSVFQ